MSLLLAHVANRYCSYLLATVSLLILFGLFQTNMLLIIIFCSSLLTNTNLHFGSVELFCLQQCTSYHIKIWKRNY